MAPGLDQENEFQESFPTSLGGAVPRALTAGIASAGISSRSLCPDPLDLQWAAQARGFRGANELPSHPTSWDERSVFVRRILLASYRAGSVLADAS
ncbi:hypothetical protein DRJ58_05880 [Candidatus Acetothermia bacterium]|nr:MAG: hypothetical protein DRJ58_05880 [Candidatus Acetothermia bacterium]